MNPQYMQQPRPPLGHGPPFDYAMSSPSHPGQPTGGVPAQNGPSPSPHQQQHPYNVGPPTGFLPQGSGPNPIDRKPSVMGVQSFMPHSGPPPPSSNANYQNGGGAPPTQQPYPPRPQGTGPNSPFPPPQQNMAHSMSGGPRAMPPPFRPGMGPPQMPGGPSRPPTNLPQQMSNLSLNSQLPPVPTAGNGPNQHLQGSQPMPPSPMAPQSNYGPPPNQHIQGSPMMPPSMTSSANYGPPPSLGQQLQNTPTQQYSNVSQRPTHLPPGSLQSPGQPPHHEGGPAPNGVALHGPPSNAPQMQPQHQQRLQGPAMGHGFHPSQPSHQPNIMAGSPYGEPTLNNAPPMSQGPTNEPPHPDSMNGLGRQANAMLPPSQQFNMGPSPPPQGAGMPPGSQYGQPMPSRYPGPTSPGLPPHSGMNQNFNRMPLQQQGPTAMQYPQQPQQQQRRLDPEMMPSPIQVIEDNRKDREGVFCTNVRGQVPPLVTTDFITQDQGNCNPRFMRSSMYTVPSTPDMMKQTAIPFTITISPFAKLANKEQPPPIVQFGPSGPVRCIRCKAYMCPYMQFVDGGRRFQCSFCRATTEVPAEYFAHLDHTGQRVDKYERAELCFGSYEFIATEDYCKNNKFPLPPAFIFIIDVSYNNVKSGVVHLLCRSMKTVLSNLPRDGESSEDKVKVGFITYSSSVQFYNLKSCLAQPQVMVVPDVQDMFMPLLDGFLVDLQESETIIDSLMEQIPVMYEDNRETETILGPAIKAGLEALKAADRSGKLFIFHSSLPIAEAPGKLKNRDDRKLLGTDKEKTVLAPQNTFYNQLGQDCVTAGCSVDLFTFPNAYIDIATIGQISRLTGGQIHKYTYFVAEVDGVRFIEDLCRTVSEQVAFDAVMRVRTSTGVRPTDFFGNYFMSNTTDVELAAVDTNKAICIEIKHDDKLSDEDAIYIQTAVLYTSVGGQRRLRIHNLSLNTCTQMADLYRNCELDALMNYFSKACLRQLCEQTPKQVKDALINKCAQSLACYRKNCASPSSAGQLILPECMKLLPLYVNCLLKSDAIAGGSDMTTDDRSFAMQTLNSMDVCSSLGYIYPRLIPLHNLNPDSENLPTALRCTFEKLQDNGVYLLENGIFMFIWVGMNAHSEFLQNVFGVQSASQIDIDKSSVLDLDNPISQSVRRVISEIREERQRFMKMFIIRQRDKLETVFKHFLVEDKGIDDTPSYVEFLCHVHKEIRNLLS